MKAYLALGQGWSRQVRLERACFARLFHSIGVPTFTTAPNPVYLKENGIDVITSLEGVTDLFLYTMQVDAIGGVLNRLLVSDEFALSRFEGRIWHLAVDTKIPPQSLYRWAKYKKREVPGAQDWVGTVYCISQARNTEALKEAYSSEYAKFSVKALNFIHAPLELNRAFAPACEVSMQPQTPLVYIGGDRQGKRTRHLGNFLMPVKDQVTIVGSVTRVFSELYPELNVLESVVRSDDVYAAYQLGRVAIALGDKNYHHLKHYTPRLYEAPIAGRVTVIHDEFIHPTETEFPTEVWPRIRSAVEALYYVDRVDLIEAQRDQLLTQSQKLVDFFLTL